jgi:hypothetical protein
MSAPQTTVSPVDTTNDHQMVRYGLRPEVFFQDPEWHRKSLSEKDALSKFKKIKGWRLPAPVPVKRTVPHNIVVHLKNLKKEVNFKTTYCSKIYEDQILNYMKAFFEKMKEEILVVYFNGKIYPISL